MSLTPLQYVIWFAGPVVMLCLGIIMYRRKLHASFPMFFTYALFHVVSNIALFVASQISYRNYFYAYWVVTCLGIILGFLVIHEVFEYAIRPYAGLRDLARLMFHWVALVMLLVCGIIGFTSPGTNFDHLVLVLVNLERGIRLMQVGMLLFVAVFSGRLGLTWRDLPCGIAVGFGIYATVNLTMFSLRAQLGPEWNALVSRVTSLTFVGCTLIWLGYSLLPQAARVRVSVPFHPIFDRWNQAALAVSGSGVAQTAPPADQPTYLTDLQQTVETIMEKSNGKKKFE